MHHSKNNKIIFHIGAPIICGGILVPCYLIGELRKRGINAYGIADWQDEQLTKIMGVNFKDESYLHELKEEDTLIAVRWEKCNFLSGFLGRKIQYVQGRDEDANYGDDWKAEMRKARNDKSWELIGVSQFCLNDWGRGTVIPNGISSTFFVDLGLERDIDCIFEGNRELAKGYQEAIDILSNIE